jgi:dTDP-glucose pyrophosphorylase
MRKDEGAAELAAEQKAMAETVMKGMIPIGRPFLDYVLAALADAGFTSVCLVIGPEHAAARKHYEAEAPPSRLTIEFAIQEKPLGTADAVLAAEEFCGDEPFVVINSDNYYPAEALSALRSTNPPAIAAFARSALIGAGNVEPERVGRFGALEIDADGHLVRITPKEGVAPSDGAEIYASMNCWLFDSRIFEACRSVPLSPRGELELPRAVQLSIDSMGVIFSVVRLNLPVLDMTSRTDISAVQRRLEGASASY